MKILSIVTQEDLNKFCFNEAELCHEESNHTKKR